ncbi:hypothetical protein SPOG_01848 [Schizosaccharomyces cryophilus OY26]|uniref:Uncharacterized protein n=1 Tax=Schizosaccharomyces cryophilus (strain OY26 / ATCC MYA-4695 / CBS 11777 / NBRC 106824 / NRRL Y48691) TaxID=653667 RepID=S9X601_SCHCR|nr:uncharacterized protein SPOG_01848 [Schizosaccharomyces cryophilus OY26]EPY52527.1 hypothetical protein SPOG_01848 [Schizosaccharomyces cryophilus OY26]
MLYVRWTGKVTCGDRNIVATDFGKLGQLIDFDSPDDEVITTKKMFTPSSSDRYA